ncbi:protein kinase [Candidatus Woesearchaeota archaeon]|nr:protein kinase [Candidatus Woesearchaeota archaeon]
MADEIEPTVDLNNNDIEIEGFAHEKVRNISDSELWRFLRLLLPGMDKPVIDVEPYVKARNAHMFKGKMLQSRKGHKKRDVLVKVHKHDYDPAKETHCPEKAERFRDEFKIQQGLSGKCDKVVKIYSFGNLGKGYYFDIYEPLKKKIKQKDADLLYTVSEFIEGFTLKHILRNDETRKSCRLINRVKWAEDIVEALKTVHDEGYVHRDIKPDNIVISKQDNMAKLTDFGIARKQGCNKYDEKHTIWGNPFYTPPERIMGETETDARSDIYSLGVVLYELITGNHPLSDGEKDFKRIIDQSLKSRINPIRNRNRFVQGLCDITEKCLEKDPSKRYQSLGNLKVDLDDYIVNLRNITNYY